MDLYLEMFIMSSKFNKSLSLIVASIVLSVLVGAFNQISSSESDSKHWDYGGTWNPTRWGELDPEYALCGTGTNQSPINLDPQTATESSSEIKFNYGSSPLRVVNTGHTIEAELIPGSYAEIEGEKYELEQFHFHTPSEHHLDGKAAAGALHLVHSDRAGDLAVVGVFIEEGEYNPVLGAFREHIPLEPGENQTKDVSLDVNLLLPPNRSSYYHYLGSLTTPPCSEGVKWYVMVNPIQVSPEQIANFRKIYQVNVRPVQALNGREVQLKN